jgi:hypothetical protein
MAGLCTRWCVADGLEGRPGGRGGEKLLSTFHIRSCTTPPVAPSQQAYGRSPSLLVCAACALLGARVSVDAYDTTPPTPPPPRDVSGGAGWGRAARTPPAQAKLLNLFEDVTINCVAPEELQVLLLLRRPSLTIMAGHPLPESSCGEGGGILGGETRTGRRPAVSLSVHLLLLPAALVSAAPFLSRLGMQGFYCVVVPDTRVMVAS